MRNYCIDGSWAEFSSDSQFVWTGNLLIEQGLPKSQITVYQTQTMTRINQNSIDGVVAEFSPDSQFVWICNRNRIIPNRKTTVYHTQTMDRINQNPIDGGWPKFSPDGKILFVLNQTKKTVTLYALPSLEQIRQISDVIEFTCTGANYTCKLTDGNTCIINCADSGNSQHHMALLAAMHRRHATGEVAAVLDRAADWQNMIRGAAVDQQAFVKHTFAPAPVGDAAK